MDGWIRLIDGSIRWIDGLIDGWMDEIDWFIDLLIDWLIDLHWVRVLTVPMHVDLKNMPFVPHNLISAQHSPVPLPHNLISAQHSPVPLPQLQMAPRLKILISSGSKKGSQIYYPFVSKSPGKRIHSRVPNGAPMERDTRLQGTFTSVLIYFLMSKALGKERSVWKQTPISEPCLTYLLGPPVKEPFLQVPLMKSPRRNGSF